MTENILPIEPNEEWREIPETRGKYFVSSIGRVASCFGGHYRILRQTLLKATGYYRVDVLQKPQLVILEEMTDEYYGNENSMGIQAQGGSQGEGTRMGTGCMPHA